MSYTNITEAVLLQMSMNLIPLTKLVSFDSSTSGGAQVPQPFSVIIQWDLYS